MGDVLNMDTLSEQLTIHMLPIALSRNYSLTYTKQEW